MAFTLKIVTLISVLFTIFFSARPVQADTPARLYLQNVPLQDEKLLVVNVQLADVADLYGAEVQFRYDPAQLRVRDDNPRLEGAQIAPGPLLAFDDRFVATNRADPERGVIDFVFTLLRPAPPISGQGVLATVVFEILGDGPFTVEVSKVQLVSSASQPLPVTAKGLHLDNELRPTAETPPVAPAGPVWGWWIGLVVLAALAGLAVLLVKIRLRQVRPAVAEVTATSSRPQPGQGRSSRQSAELLTRQANHLLEQGSLPAAYELFSQAVELDPGNVQAWLGKGLVARQEIERSICFQRVLALDPDNELAKRELQR